MKEVIALSGSLAGAYVTYSLWCAGLRGMALACIASHLLKTAAFALHCKTTGAMKGAGDGK